MVDQAHLQDKLSEVLERKRELNRLARELQKASGKNWRQEDIRNRAAQIGRANTASAREISRQLQLKVKDPKRREQCGQDLGLWLRTYCKEAFPLPFSADHDRLIETTQKVCTDGGRIVAALPRSSGKTTIFQRAIIWAALNGHSKFAILACAEAKQAIKLTDGLKTLLQHNDLLAEDYPEVIAPIRLLEGVAMRGIYQLYRGRPTKLAFGSDHVRFPTLLTEEGPNCGRGNAGVVIMCGGITSAMRGAVITDLDGTQRRPDLILIDDPSTRKSAHSPSSNQEREDIMQADLAGMSGHTGSIGMLCALTVIEPDDLACRLLDNERNPDWISIKVPMLYSMPTNLDLWDKYDDIRRQEVVFELPPGSANKFYNENREALDEGCIHYWPDRINEGRISAIQSAMDAYLKSPRSFASEYQNEPERAMTGDLDPLVSLDLQKRRHPYKRGVCPPDVVNITAHIDVQQSLLYWAVVGWSQNLRGYLLDIGAWPKQTKRYWDLRNVTKTLQKASPKNDVDGAIQAGIEACIRYLAGQTYQHGEKLFTIDVGLVDARYKSDQVENALIAAEQKNWMPAYGTGIGAKNAPMSQWPKKPGRRHGDHWALQTPERKRLRSMFVDVNHWKSELYNSLKVPKEHSDAITWFDTRARSELQMISDHCTAEIAIRVEASNRVIDEWELPPHQPDNHHWDNLVGCMAAASYLGLKRKRNAHHGQKKPKKKYGVRELTC